MTYTYICSNCGKAFDKNIPIAHYIGTQGVECPYCSSRDIRRTYVIPANVIYKDKDFTQYREPEE